MLLTRLLRRTTRNILSSYGARRLSAVSKLPKYDARVFRVSEEVADAVSTNKPVVALETTIYTHGFPYPESADLATHLEDVVRRNGAVPATIGVLEGIARVGMTHEELLVLAASGGKPETMKISRRDLSYITGVGLTGRKLNGGTTISGTMILAEMAGIEVFGTGGLGGVHRGGQDTMDISADLTELGRTPVTVISSGCKSFLDLKRTLEYLETQGVCVGTFRDGRPDPVEMPAFYTRDSGIQGHVVLENEQEAAAIIYSRRLLGLKSGLHFANPIPERYSIPQTTISKVIEEAVTEAAERGYHGHRNTPFILSKIKELTGDKSVAANKALVTANVERAAKVAVELSKLGSTQRGTLTSVSQNDRLSKPVSLTLSIPTSTERNAAVITDTSPQPSIFVAGSIAVDLSCDYISLQGSTAPMERTSNPASISQSIGGVGHNVARAVHLSSPPSTVRLCSVVADDLSGNLILSTLNQQGMDTLGIKLLPADQWRTAQYIAINDAKKDLVLAMADMDIVGSQMHDFENTWLPTLKECKPKWVVVDGNWHYSIIKKWCTASKAIGAKIAFEPVSVEKSKRLFPSIREVRQLHDKKAMAETDIFPCNVVDIATPNEYELEAMYTIAKQNDYFDSQAWWEVIDSFGIPSTGARVQMAYLTNATLVDKGVPQQVIQLLPFIPVIIVKLGSQGVLMTRILGRGDAALTNREEAQYILSRCNNNNANVGGIYMRLFGPAEVVDEEHIVSVNGIGDTFLGILVAGLANGLQLNDKLIAVAQRGAVMSLKSSESVHPDLGILKDELRQRNGI